MDMELPEGWVHFKDLKLKHERPLPPKKLVDGKRTILLGREEGKPMGEVTLKKHKVENPIPEKPVGRTLIASLIPPYAFEDNVKLAFSVYGDIENVYLHPELTPGLPPKEHPFYPKKRKMRWSVAYIVFKTKEGLQNAMDVNSCAKLYLTNESTPTHTLFDVNSDLEKKRQAIDPVAKYKEAVEMLNRLDLEVEAKAKEDKKASTEADEEGWLSMTKSSRKKGIPRKRAVMDRIKEGEEKKIPRKQFNDFYKFQTRETKKENLKKMRERFAEDQRKVAQMKESKRFKPNF